MQRQDFPGTKLYRLELSDDGLGSVRTIEFAADGMESALHAAQRHGSGRDITVFENGRPLARLRLAAGHGPGP